MNEILNLFNDVINQAYMGVSLPMWLLGIGIFITVLLLRQVMVSILTWKIRRIVDSTSNPFDNSLLSGLAGPISFFPIVLGLGLALLYVQPDGTAGLLSQNVFRTLVLVNIFWVFYGLIEPLHFLFMWLEKSFNTTLRLWAMKIIRVVIALTGVATVLEVWGVQIAPILAGLGLLGMAVALAAQDMFRNLLSGMMILSERRFVRGDWVSVDGIVEGVVENIGFRSTLVRRFDDVPVYVPNSQFAETAVINYSGMTARRISWTVGLEYRTSAKQLRAIRDDIETWLQNNEQFVSDGSKMLEVRLSAFNDSSVDLMVYCFTTPTGWRDWLVCKEELLLAIKEIVEEKHKAGFAFPSVSIYKEN